MGAVYEKIARSKYKAICQRSFKTRLELFLFESVLETRLQTRISIEHFLSFKPSDSLIDRLEEAWQKEEIQVEASAVYTSFIDSSIVDWLSKNESLTKNLLGQYEKLFGESVLTFGQFTQVFPEDPRKRICHYTGLSDFDFEEMRKNGKIKTKNARGRFMEIDRLNSNREYYMDNIVLCCYWANNAKTDEFTYPEFVQYVGPAMEKVFRERMSPE